MSHRSAIELVGCRLRFGLSRDLDTQLTELAARFPAARVQNVLVELKHRYRASGQEHHVSLQADVQGRGSGVTAHAVHDEAAAALGAAFRLLAEKLVRMSVAAADRDAVSGYVITLHMKFGRGHLRQQDAGALHVRDWAWWLTRSRSDGRSGLFRVQAHGFGTSSPLVLVRRVPDRARPSTGQAPVRR